MKLNLVITAALLSLTAGLVTWAVQPTHKAFSWIETISYEYLVGLVPHFQAPPTGDPPSISFLEYQDALDSLRQNVHGRYYPFVSSGGMGQHLILSDEETYPIFREVYATEGYFEARQVHALHGQLLQFDTSGSTELVLGYALARQIFTDPAAAVGRTVRLGTLGSHREPKEYVIVGVASPSPAQNPAFDVDEGLVATLQSAIEDREWSFRIQPLYIQVTFHDPAEVPAVLPQLEVWVKDYFGPEGRVVAFHELMPEEGHAFIAETQPKITLRRHTLLGFGVLLILAGLLALYAQSHWYLLRQRQLLGVEKALGASRRYLALQLLTAQIPWGTLGSFLGVVSLIILTQGIPQVFLGRPPHSVLLAAFLLPVVALLMVAGIVTLPVVKESPMALLRGRMASSRIWALLLQVYGGLALAVAAGLATTHVALHVQEEVTALQRHFGQMYALQKGAPLVDSRLERAFEAPGGLQPLFGEEDAVAVMRLPGVEDATLMQPIPNLGVMHGTTQTRVPAAAADGNYVRFMGLELQEGEPGGCLVDTALQREWGIRVGEVIQLLGLHRVVPCEVTGVFATPPPLWTWLVADMPQLITPPLDGIGLNVPGYDAEPFRSTRILLSLSEADVEAAVRGWQRERFPNPNEHAEVIPYTPNAQELLSTLSAQAQLFLLLALLAAILSVWSIVGGFLALLDIERFRIALDRAFGLSLKGLTYAWWWRTFGLGVVSASLGVGLAHELAVRLYNAFALDVPNLPVQHGMALNLPLLGGLAITLLLLSTALTRLARTYLERRSTLQLLKEGA
jgi:hypothetical protein